MQLLVEMVKYMGEWATIWHIQNFDSSYWVRDPGLQTFIDKKFRGQNLNRILKICKFKGNGVVDQRLG